MLNLSSAYASPISAPHAPALKVMTFNLRFASEQGTHPWSGRRHLIAAAIEAQAPDLLGTQEGLYGQLSDIATDLPGYGWIGEGRKGGHEGEFSAIFYRKDCLRVLEQGNFWLSATPEIPGSRTWGNLLPRMATWALFEQTATGTRFYHFNTHFDHLIPYARTRGAELLARRIAGRKLPVPVVVTGDFNTDQFGKVHGILAGRTAGATGLVDTWGEAAAREGQLVSTFHGWRGPDHAGKHIDWILATPDFVCRRASVVTFNQDGQWPSDHFPVVSELALNVAAREPLIAEKIGTPLVVAR